MKFLCRATCALLAFSCALHAQKADDEEEESAFIDSSPDFSDLIIYTPKSSVSVGFRGVSGAKSTFGGTGTLGTVDPSVLGEVGSNLDHTYHDGYVNHDTRTQTDAAGNTVPIDPDGKTNNWNYTDAAQETTDGLIAMHGYAVATSEAGFTHDQGNSFGVEVVMSRQMIKLFNGRVSVELTGGASINDVTAAVDSKVASTLTTVTDYYSLDGQLAPGENGVALASPVVLLGRDTLQRLTESGKAVEVNSHWKLKGAYLSARIGPTIVVPITPRFTASVSVGGVLVYSGTNYAVTQSFLPETGDTLVETVRDGASEIMPGYYVDANLQFNFTVNTGLYLGAVYQSSGDYTQKIEDWNGKDAYSAKVDLSSLQGFRAGFLLKF